MKHYTRGYPGWVRYKVKEPKAIKIYTSKAYRIYTEYLNLKYLGVTYSSSAISMAMHQGQLASYRRHLRQKLEGLGFKLISNNTTFEEYVNLSKLYQRRRSYKLTETQQAEYADLKRLQAEENKDVLGFGNRLHSAISRSFK